MFCLCGEVELAFLTLTPADGTNLESTFSILWNLHRSAFVTRLESLHAGWTFFNEEHETPRVCEFQVALPDL